MVRVQTRSIVCAAAILGLWSLAAAAQQQTPGKPPGPAPAQGPALQAAPPANAPAINPPEGPAGSAAESLVGLDVFSSEGTRVGEVRSVDTRPNGDIAALHVKTGGFLGFGGRIVVIPGGRFARKGQSIRLDIDAEQVDKLPEVKD